MPPKTSSMLGPLEISADSLVLRRRLLFKFAIFLCLEMLFITLAITCLIKPTSFPLPSSSTQIKAGFTALFIAWHTFAISNGQDVVLHGLSSEWYIRYQESGNLTPGHTDIVSTIRAGIQTRIRYFFSKQASPSYRTSFLAYWSLLALVGIAPGVINVDTVPQFSPAEMNITNFTITGGSVVGDLAGTSVLAQIIVEFELRENTPFGFSTPDHIITAWPDVRPGELTHDIRYESDVVLYDMTCWWEAPSAVNQSAWGTTWYVGGYAWYPWIIPLSGNEMDGGLMPMFRFSTDQEFVPENPPLTLPAVNPLGMSGYMFYGRNTSFPDPVSGKRNINLDGLPTIYNASGFPFIGYNGAESHFESPLATFLLCDPHARIMDGQVSVEKENITLSVPLVSTPVNGITKIGNISPDAANAALGFGLLTALDREVEGNDMRVGELAARAFLDDTSLNFGSVSSNHTDPKILSLPEIQRNLNAFMSSAAKATSSYARSYGVNIQTPLFLVPVRGEVQNIQPVLVASKGLLIPSIVLFVMSAAALILDIFWLHIWKKPSFKLKSLIQCNDEISKSEQDFPSPEDPQDCRPRTLNLILRLLGFTALEVAFSFLVLVCSMRNVFIGAPFSSAEIKGGLTTIFILWQALAIFLLSDAISFAFSGEWSIQKSLTPGISDWVSRLTSGDDDRARYFFKVWSSNTFRMAFLTSLLLTALKSFAPGTLSLSTVSQWVDTPLQIADLQFLSPLRADSIENADYVQFLHTRANSVLLLEQGFGDAALKYELADHWMTAWPDESSIESNFVGSIDFPTDVVFFNYTCTWRVPELGFDGNWTGWFVDGQSWALLEEPLPGLVYQGGILPLYRPVDTQPDALSAYLFVGTNDSFPVDSDQTKWSIINLNNLPTLVHPDGFVINVSSPTPSHWISPLSTVLLCDPHIKVSGGRAQLTQTKKLNVTFSGLPRIGNLPDEAINNIFTQALVYPFSAPDASRPGWIGTLSAGGFLKNADQDFTDFPHGMGVFDLETINTNINRFFLSASKAFTDGFYFSSSDQSKFTRITRSVTGAREVGRQVLVGDKMLGIVSSSLSVGALIFFGRLAYLLVITPGVVPFELKYILRALDERRRCRGSQRATLGRCPNESGTSVSCFR